MNKKQKAKLLANGLPGVIKSATVSRHASGNYFVSILLEEVVPLQTKPDILTVPDDKIIGIDLGLSHFAILSTGEKIENPKFYQRSLKKLAKMQRKFSKMIKGSQNYIKQSKKIAKLHLHIKNMRHDFLHKVSRKLVNENQVIVLENLNVKGMIKNKKLAKSIQDVGWGYFKTFLSYKAEWENKHVIFVDRFFPSSKLCGGCNEKNTMLSLSDREWVCPSCGNTHDRDINAAENIKKEGLRLLGLEPVIV